MKGRHTVVFLQSSKLTIFSYQNNIHQKYPHHATLLNFRRFLNQGVEYLEGTSKYKLQEEMFNNLRELFNDIPIDKVREI